MKILIVSEMSLPYAVGGGEVRYALLAKELVRRGHEVTWLSMRQRNSPDEEVIDGVRHLHRGPRIASPPTRPLVAMLRFMFTAFWHVLTHRYDVIDCQTYAPLPAVWLAGLLSRQKIVATIHDTSSWPATTAPRQSCDDQWLSARHRLIVGPVETLLYRLPYWRVLTVSGAVGRTLVARFRVAERRLRVVPNGIDTDTIAATRAASEQVDMLFVGRVIPHKHVDDFLDAVAAVGRSRLLRGLPMLRATVVGEGPLLAEMQARAARLGLMPGIGVDAEPRSATVTFCGRVTDHAAVIGLIKSALVLVLPSTREGFGLVLGEAFACGTPCVAYDVPAVREVLADGEAGVLVAPRDVVSLAAACEDVLADSCKRERLIAAGRRRVTECYAASVMAHGVFAVYEN